jgi:hypothetical protein
MLYWAERSGEDTRRLTQAVDSRHAIDTHTEHQTLPFGSIFKIGHSYPTGLQNRNSSPGQDTKAHQQPHESYLAPGQLNWWYFCPGLCPVKGLKQAD